MCPKYFQFPPRSDQIKQCAKKLERTENKYNHAKIDCEAGRRAILLFPALCRYNKSSIPCFDSELLGVFFCLRPFVCVLRYFHNGCVLTAELQPEPL